MSCDYFYRIYQNQSIGRELTAPDTYCKVTLSLKNNDMIKSHRFKYRINKFKAVT